MCVRIKLNQTISLTERLYDSILLSKLVINELKVCLLSQLQTITGSICASSHDCMCIHSLLARKRKSTAKETAKVWLYFLGCALGLVCCEPGQRQRGLDTICVTRQAKNSYRWETFILGMEQPRTGKEKHGRITGTIWSSMLLLLNFFFSFLSFCFFFFWSCLLGNLP